jgi:methylamine utilization protein MauE
VASLVSGVAALTVVLMFLVALAEHARSPGGLRRALLDQGVLPRALAWPVAGAVLAVEGALAGAGGLGVLAGPDGVVALRVSLGVSVVLFAVYAAYSQYLVMTRAGAPCGCSGGDTPVNRWVVGRAVLLACLAGTGLLLAKPATTLAASPQRLGVAAAAALTFAVLLWHLPVALEDPVQAVLAEGRRQLRAGWTGGR